MYFSMQMWLEGAFYSFLALFNGTILYVVRSPYYKSVGIFASIFINMLFMFMGKVMGDESIIQVFLISAIISTYYYTVSKTSIGKFLAFMLVVAAYITIEILIHDEHLSFMQEIHLKGFVSFLFISFGLLANVFTYNYLNSINWIAPVREEELFRVVSNKIDFESMGEDDSFTPDELDGIGEEEVFEQYDELEEIVTCAELHLVINKVGDEKFVHLSAEVEQVFEVDIKEAMEDPYTIWEKVIDKKNLLKNTFSSMPTKRCITTQFHVQKNDGTTSLMESIGIVHFEDSENLLHIHEMITEIRDPEQIRR